MGLDEERECAGWVFRGEVKLGNAACPALCLPPPVGPEFYAPLGSSGMGLDQDTGMLAGADGNVVSEHSRRMAAMD